MVAVKLQVFFFDFGRGIGGREFWLCVKVLDLQSRNFGCTGPNEEDIKQLPRTFSFLLNLSFAPAHIPIGMRLVAKWDSPTG